MDPVPAIPPLDPNMYSLDMESLTFFRSLTGIHDDDELRKHILNVQAQAYAVHPYPCIRLFGFTRPKISRMPIYKDVLKLGKEREGALLLDIGCGLGHDARKAAFDGFPAERIVASDLRRELWDLGHELFRSTPESFPATFLAGDVLDPAFLSPLESGLQPLTDSEAKLSNVSTLNDLHGRFSVIWASSFFHIFSERDQSRLAHAMGSLLSSESGSIIFGAHLGLPQKGILEDKISEKEVRLFCHDPESWKEMWLGPSTPTPNADGHPGNDDLDRAVFSPESVILKSKLIPLKGDSGEQVWFLGWNITRM